MAIPPRTPVVVGVGELTHRGEGVVDPIDLAAEAARRALQDASATIGHRIDTVATPGILLTSRDNPASRIAEAAGLAPNHRISCPVGGNTPQYLVEELGRRIWRGVSDAVLVVGAESGASARKVTSGGALMEPKSVAAQDESLGDTRPGLSPAEMRAGLHWPHEVYPIFESAIAARAGRTFDEQRRWLGNLMAPFTLEASRHSEQAWFPRARSADELSAVSPDNRMVGEPYPKLLNSIIAVDMAAAFVILAAETAEELGVPRHRWVFPWTSATCNDVYFPVQRPELGRSAGIRAAGEAVLAASGLHVDDVTWFDFYSCFPSAVEAAIDAFDLDPADARGFTVTGGLPYHGGPGNNYVSHSIVEMVRRCRSEPGGVGLVSGLGWYITKHSLGLWSATPPPTGWQTPDMVQAQSAIDATALEVAPPADASGQATIDGYTVVHDRDQGPSWVPVFARLSDGRRVVARNDDAQVAMAMSEEMFVGQQVSVRHADGHVEFELL
ncbi:acetyl-CoA acetyltransferase [Mycolicibacterium lutetiense]|uniref:Acetyl-CoA C-acetyltransferase n=1 Tax=Mycolicibacterium lutetiense TaxID=1641992 RepID=A0ABS5A1R6_9MYCO|nr:acetyl-CoA acetyltransferase [Mycolicibacterium lutetiense]MBP2455702.1 acetyl-CoA C-acetyltransferase [Mycolicibacterium lutetiense]